MCVCVCVCVCIGCSIVSNSATPWTVACQAPLEWARILEWVVISYSRGSSQPGDQTCISVSPAFAGGFFTAMPLGNPICIPALNEKAL